MQALLGWGTAPTPPDPQDTAPALARPLGMLPHPPGPPGRCPRPSISWAADILLPFLAPAALPCSACHAEHMHLAAQPWTLVTVTDVHLP